MNFSVLILILFVSIPVIFIILAIIQNHLGKAEVKVTNGEIFSPGDVVEGVISISSDKRRHVNEARVLLTCAINSRKKNHPLTFFTDKIVIDGNFTIMPGQPWSKPYSITIPTSIPELPQILLMQGGLSVGELPGVEKQSELEKDVKGSGISSMISLSKPKWQLGSEADISFGTITSEKVIIRVVND